jgi:pterin-4a-carbinolamine dehydratase
MTLLVHHGSARTGADGPRAFHATTGVSTMPTRLTDALVTDALSALFDWTGDSTAISRTVALSPREAEELLRAVTETAESMRHRAGVLRAAGSVTFQLSTPAVGGVTVLDIMMASRIDDLVGMVTGQPVRHRYHRVLSVARDQTTGTEADDLDEGILGVPSARGGIVGPMPSDEPGDPEPGVAERQGMHRFE